MDDILSDIFRQESSSSFIWNVRTTTICSMNLNARDKSDSSIGSNFQNIRIAINDNEMRSPKYPLYTTYATYLEVNVWIRTSNDLFVSNLKRRFQSSSEFNLRGRGRP